MTESGNQKRHGTSKFLWRRNLRLLVFAVSAAEMVTESVALKVAFSLPAILLLASTHLVQAEVLPAPEDRLTEILNDYHDDCAAEARRLKKPEGASEVQLGATAIKEVLYRGKLAVVLDASQMRCGDGHSGYCGSAGCSIFVFLRERTVVLLGALSVTDGFGDDNPLFCSPIVDDWEGCEPLMEHVGRLLRD